MDLLDQIPGYRAAVEREVSSRDESFVDAPEFVAGVELLPMTIRHFAMLIAIRSPFACGGTPDATDVARALWALSPQYEWAYWWKSRIEKVSPRLAGLLFGIVRWRFVSGLRRLDSAAVLNGLYAYIAEAFQDAPAGGKVDGATPSYWSVFASLVDTFAAEYHWSEDEILNMRFKCAWQYLRVVRKRKSGDSIFFNPSDKIRSEWLKSLNRKN